MLKLIEKSQRLRNEERKRKNTYMRQRIILRKEGDMYVAEDPEVGTVSQGKSQEEAVTNLKEATELYLEEFPRRHSERNAQTFRLH